MSHPHSVLAASRRTIASKEPCKHCGRTNHSSDTYFAKHLEKLTEFRARRAARGRGTPSTPRGSVSIAATSSASAPPLSWVLDSGVFFHVTFDPSHLVACKPVTDGALMYPTFLLYHSCL